MKITFDPHNEDDIRLVQQILEAKKKPQTEWDAIIHNSGFMVAKLAVRYFLSQPFTFDKLAQISGWKKETLIAYWRNLSKTTLGASMLEELPGHKPKCYCVPDPIAIKIKEIS